MPFAVGQTFRTSLRVERSLVERFAKLSGDNNPVHLDDSIARTFGYPRPVAHGALLTAAISRLIGTQVPGAGAIWMGQQIEWLRPVFVGDDVTIEVAVEDVSHGTGVLLLRTRGVNQHGQLVMDGTATVKANNPLGQSMSNLEGRSRIALVTGGGRGIGAAIAKELAKQGFGVAIDYRAKEESAEAVARDILEGGGRAVAHRADVGVGSEVDGLAEMVVKTLGHVDVVVHAATRPVEARAVADLSLEDAEAHMRVALGGAINLVRVFSPAMAERRFGRFVFIGTSAMRGVPPKGWASYLAAKHAVWGFARSIAHELGPVGITCNVVSPGLTVTDLTEDVPVRAKEVEARRNPTRRLATPEDTAALVTFLAGDQAGHINGANLPIDGGLA